jgi:hypothetical protein
MSSPQPFAEIERGTDEVLPREEFRNRLIEAEKKGQRLVVKAGFDPTAKDLHLGHTLLLNRMRALQERGHEVIFLIGDFTGMIGDPTGKNARGGDGRAVRGCWGARTVLRTALRALVMAVYVLQLGHVDQSNCRLANDIQHQRLRVSV